MMQSELSKRYKELGGPNEEIVAFSGYPGSCWDTFGYCSVCGSLGCSQSGYIHSYVSRCRDHNFFTLITILRKVRFFKWLQELFSE